MKKTTVRAIDVGYGNTKFTTGQEENTITCQMLPSLVATSSPLSLSTELDKQRDIVEVTLNNKTFYVGPDVSSMLTQQHTHPLHSGYVHSDEYMALHLGALHYMGVSEIDTLVLGLPVHLLAKLKDDVKQKFTGEIALADGKIVTIKNVIVIAQPLGGFLNYAKQHALIKQPGFKKMKSLIIDPGHYTFDWLVTEGYLPINPQCGAEDGGMSDVLKHVAQAIEQDEILNPQGLPFTNYREIDLGLRQGYLHVFGQRVDIKPYLSNAISYTKHVFNELLNKAGHGADIQNVILVGGAAPYFELAAKTFFPSHQINIVKDPIYANVRGFQILGQNLANSQQGAEA